MHAAEKSFGELTHADSTRRTVRTFICEKRPYPLPAEREPDRRGAQMPALPIEMAKRGRAHDRDQLRIRSNAH